MQGDSIVKESDSWIGNAFVYVKLVRGLVAQFFMLSDDTCQENEA